MIRFMKTIFSKFRYHLIKRLPNSRRKVPIYIFGHHKCGTKLLTKIFLKLCIKYGWKFKSVSGFAHDIPKADIVHFIHSQVDISKLPREYIGIHMIRDPRDVIISGYLYHKRTTEEWCVNKNFDTKNTIFYPKIPHSQMHRSRDWKVHYIESLEGKSYQENINDLNEEDAILFEMNHYAKWVIDDMLKWDYSNSNCKELKFETLMNNFDQEIESVFEYCNFDAKQMLVAKKIAKKEDLSKMSKTQISKNPHISSNKTNKWKQYFTKNISTQFQNQYKGVLDKLNY